MCRIFCLKKILVGLHLTFKYNKLIQVGRFDKFYETRKTMEQEINCAFFGTWNNGNVTYSENRLYNILKILLKDFGVREFRSPAGSDFEKAVENALLRMKKNFPEITLVYFEKYPQTTVENKDFILKRYDKILSPVEEDVKTRLGKATMFGKLDWLAENSDFVFIHSCDDGKMYQGLKNIAEERFLFDLRKPPRSWKKFVAEKSGVAS